MAGFDVKAVLDGIISFASQNYILLLAGVALLILFSNRGVFARIRHGIEKALTDNWQLTLLASTGIALSLASGYTTFDGLRNFTSAPLLSVFISFGIQGVMLIVAWLIGESFAVGMNQRTAGRPAPAPGRRQRRHAARRGLRRHRLLLDAAPVQRREPHQQAGVKADWSGSPTCPSTSCWRWCWWACWPSASGAAATSPRPTCRACA